MTDLFDIANLITTVSVDGVKIKQEAGLPEKSSNEILTELFSTFDTPDDGIASPLNSDQQVPNDDIKTAESNKLQTKKKKIKKKHKHKEKKHKKKSRHDSSDNSDAEGNERVITYYSALHDDIITYLLILIRCQEKEETQEEIQAKM